MACKRDDNENREYEAKDWAEMWNEVQGISAALASAMHKGPSDPEVQCNVDRLLTLINQRFFQCSIDMFRGIGDLCAASGRLREHFDRVKPGLSEFVRASIYEYCSRK
ncbi:MAG: TipAS antibiotic-recognition domain-containing protein [Bacillota bacterium]|jgi:hypothetical protein